MLNFNLLAIVSIMIFHCLSTAQTSDSFNSRQAATSNGLIFEKEIDYKLEDSSYTDVIQLFNLSEKAQAIQFRLSINKTPDDSTILIFENIQKGSDLSDPSWLMDYNVKKGPIAKNGASRDDIYIVLYNLNQDGGLLPGDYDDLFKIIYKVAAMPGLKNNIKSSMKISHVEASTSIGIAIDITPSRDELKIYVKKK